VRRGEERRGEEGGDVVLRRWDMRDGWMDGWFREDMGWEGRRHDIWDCELVVGDTMDA